MLLNGGIAMRLRLLILASVLILSGCGLATRQAAREEISKTAEAEKAECYRRYPDAHKRPVMPRIRCINQAVLREQTGYDRVRLPAYEITQSDLLRALTSQLLVIGERYDKGRLTQAEFQSQLDSAYADYQSKVFYRSQTVAQTEAAQSSATAASVAASRSAAPVIVPPARTPVCVMGRCY